MSSHADPIPIWPQGKMPGPVVVSDKPDAVRVPTLTIYPAPEAGLPPPAILVCPGGGYMHLAVDKEGTEIAKWLNTLGITAVVLQYRVPDDREGAFMDAQRAIRLLRIHAMNWNLDPKHIGMMGFSAGGHLSARVSTNFDKPSYPEIDAADSGEPRPDFVVLVYPAYLDANGAVAPELPVSGNVPPTLIIHNEDDPGFLRGSKIYHAALDAAYVPNQFIDFPTGGHGYGLRCTLDAKAWPDKCREWLATIGVR